MNLTTVSHSDLLGPIKDFTSTCILSVSAREKFLISGDVSGLVQFFKIDEGACLFLSVKSPSAVVKLHSFYSQNGYTDSFLLVGEKKISFCRLDVEQKEMAVLKVVLVKEPIFRAVQLSPNFFAAVTISSSFLTFTRGVFESTISHFHSELFPNIFLPISHRVVVVQDLFFNLIAIDLFDLAFGSIEKGVLWSFELDSLCPSAEYYHPGRQIITASLGYLYLIETKTGQVVRTDTLDEIVQEIRINAHSLSSSNPNFFIVFENSPKVCVHRISDLHFLFTVTFRYPIIDIFCVEQKELKGFFLALYESEDFEIVSFKVDPGIDAFSMGVKEPDVPIKTLKDQLKKLTLKYEEEKTADFEEENRPSVKLSIENQKANSFDLKISYFCNRDVEAVRVFLSSPELTFDTNAYEMGKDPESTKKHFFKAKNGGKVILRVVFNFLFADESNTTILKETRIELPEVDESSANVSEKEFAFKFELIPGPNETLRAEIESLTSKNVNIKIDSSAMLITGNNLSSLTKAIVASKSIVDKGGLKILYSGEISYEGVFSAVEEIDSTRSEIFELQTKIEALFEQYSKESEKLDMIIDHLDTDWDVDTTDLREALKGLSKKIMFTVNLRQQKIENLEGLRKQFMENVENVLLLASLKFLLKNLVIKKAKNTLNSPSLIFNQDDITAKRTLKGDLFKRIAVALKGGYLTGDRKDVKDFAVSIEPSCASITLVLQQFFDKLSTLV